MATAFVLINAEIGAESEVLKELKAVEQVKEAYLVYGVYDAVAKVEAETTDRLREVITSRLRKLRWVRSTLTMMVIE